MHRFLFLFAITAAGLFSSAASAADAKGSRDMRTLGLLLFDGFETLDAAGPLEMWGNMKSHVKVVTVAAKKGPVASYQGPQLVAEYGFDDCPELDLLLVPGGFGAFEALKDEATLTFVRERAKQAELTMNVCNGASILAAAGLLDGRKATTNKMSWKQSTAPGPNVSWVRQARWVDDGNIVTSSGVSAGIDMALHVIERLYGAKVADTLADQAEYERHRDANWDPFAEKNAGKRRKG